VDLYAAPAGPEARPGRVHQDSRHAIDRAGSVESAEGYGVCGPDGAIQRDGDHQGDAKRDRDFAREFVDRPKGGGQSREERQCERRSHGCGQRQRRAKNHHRRSRVSSHQCRARGARHVQPPCHSTLKINYYGSFT